MKVTYGATPERRLLTVAVAVFLLAATAGIVVLIVVGAGGSDDHPRAETRTTVRTVTVTKAAPTTSLREQLTQWFIMVQANFTEIGNDAQTIEMSSGTKLGVACHNLKRHVVTFETAQPAPEAGVRNDIARMLDAYSTAATQCLDGDLKSATAHVDTGSDWLGRAADRIKQLEGR